MKFQIKRNPWIGWSVFTPLMGLLIALGVLIQVAAFTLLKDVSEYEPLPVQESFIYYPGQGGDVSGALVEERALLYDSEPLFLPTLFNWRGGEAPRYSGEHLSETLFTSFEPQLQLSESAFQLFKPDSKPVLLGMAAAREMLDADYWGLFAGFARAQEKVSSRIPERMGFLKILKLTTGEAVFNKSISIDEAPEALLPAFTEHQEYLILITDTGLSGQPLSLDPKGPEETPVRLNERILSWVQLLPPGYYRLQLGP